jgi:hypothetical protein
MVSNSLFPAEQGGGYSPQFGVALATMRRLFYLWG